MLQERSKVMIYYATNTLKSILGLRHRNKYKRIFSERKRLDPTIIPKFMNQMDKPYIYHPMLIKNGQGNKGKRQKSDSDQLYFIDICEFKQQILPEGFPETAVLGCGGLVEDNKGRIRYIRSSPGGTFIGRRCVPIHVKWRNKLNVSANMHIYGGDAPKHDALYEVNNQGAKEEFHILLNNQEPSAYWYRGQNNEDVGGYDHLGLLGLYLLREGKKHIGIAPGQIDLPSVKYEYPIIIQDCSFYTDGSFVRPLKNASASDEQISKISNSQYFGDTILVNGKVWPNLDVERRQYRFYILNGSASRFYNLTLSNEMNFTVIGGDKGLLSSPASQKSIMLAPGERADVLIDFSRLPTGTKIVLNNNANAPYPFGDKPDPETTGQIMRFIIPDNEAFSISPLKLPDMLYEERSLPTDLLKRIHIISQNIESGESFLELDGQKSDMHFNLKTQVDSPEEWIFINLTCKAYPIYLEQVRFRIIERQYINTISFKDKWNYDISQLIDPYLLGEPIKPEQYEMGWKDTLRVEPGMVTRIVMMPN